MVKENWSCLESWETGWLHTTNAQSTALVLVGFLGILVTPFPCVRKKWPPGSGRFFLQPRALPPANSTQAQTGTSWTFSDADVAPWMLRSPTATFTLYLIPPRTHTWAAIWWKKSSHHFPRPRENAKTALDHHHGSFLLIILSLPITVLPYRPWHKVVSTDKWSWHLWSERM